MKWYHAFLLQFFLFGSLLAETATTTLNLVQEGAYGQINVLVDAPSANSNDTTTLSGILSVELEIDTDNDTVSALTVLNSDIEGTKVSFSGGNLFFNYTVNSSDLLGIGITTTTSPGEVDPVTGSYDASEHPFEINEGTLSGSANIFGNSTPMDVDFAATPFGGSNEGTGTLSISLQSTAAGSKTYSVVMIYPVNTTTPLDAGGQSIDVDITGTVKATGTITVPVPTEFEIWLSENELGDASFDEDSNQDGLANGMQWALGLAADESPEPHLLTFATSTPTAATYTIELPAGGSAGDVTVLYSSALTVAFTPLASGAVSAGNPIPAGTTGTVTITLAANDQGFVKMSAVAP